MLPIKKLKSIIFIVAILFSFQSIAKDDSGNNPPVLDSEFLLEYLSIKYPGHNFQNFIYVGVKRQKLYLFNEGKVIHTYDVSTSSKGAGTKEGSEMTPVGLHKIKLKYGDDVPVAGILKGRRYTGEIAKIEEKPVKTGRDEITSRIITIYGLEEGINKGGALDSYDRKIYIHGTAEEGLIGQPASHGCVRMKNTDIIDMYERVERDMYVIILNN